MGFVQLDALSTRRCKGDAGTAGENIWIERGEEIDCIGKRADLEKISRIGICR